MMGRRDLSIHFHEKNARWRDTCRSSIKLATMNFRFSCRAPPIPKPPDSPMVTTLRGRPHLVTFVVCLVVGLMYAPGFFGFWHGDDLPNLHRAYAQAQQGTLWPDTFRLFAEPVPSQGAFYRPMMMLSLAINYALTDAHYAGWYLVNFVVHVLNTLLVALIVGRLAARHGCDATIAAPLAALLFGLCPAIAEGVYWVSARSDGWVTLLSLAGVYFWVGRSPSSSTQSAYALPLLLIVALGFKESAAVLPLQMLLLAIAWRGPLSRPQSNAVFATFVAAGLFMIWRAYLFGNAWHVYTPDAAGGVALHAKLWSSLLSLGPWWAALGQTTPVLLSIYLILCAAGIVLLVLARPAPHWRLGLALVCASGGLALATLLNIGSMSSTGEGGRLSYGPVAWLALAVGVFISPPQSTPIKSQHLRIAASSALAMALVIGCGVLWGQLRSAWHAQTSMQTITRSIPPWAESHAGLTMLLVPENEGAVVMGRNAQGGIVLEPVQKQAYLHRVIPTLSSEIQLRQEQFCRGMALRLELVRPRLADAGTLAAIALPADTVWPKHVACWSTSQQKIIPLQAPPMDATCEAWLASIRTDVENCEH